ncbi:hypothetical protein DMENIID0001_092530 [Sergentomyia squamirostris]
MSNEFFLMTLKHFKEHAKPSPDDPILLIVDNHSSHLALHSLQFCRENNIFLVTLPPHTSDRTQPLDLSVFGPFKTKFSKDLNRWLKANPGMKMTIEYLARVSADALKKSLSPENIKSGFEEAGICPFDFTGIFKKVEEEEAKLALIQPESSSLLTSSEFDRSTHNLLEPIRSLPCTPVDRTYFGSPPSLEPIVSPELNDPADDSYFFFHSTPPPKATSLELNDPADDSYFNNFLSSLKPSVSQELCDPGENLITVCAHQSPKTLVGKRPPPEAHKFATIQRLIRNHHSMEEPLDLSMKKPEVPLSPRSSRISQLFGNLCKIKPLPHPGAFLKSSRARESHSIIATGSPEIQRRIQLAKEKEERKVTQEKKRLEAEEKRRKRKEDQQRKNEEKEERKRLKEEKKEASEAAKGKKRKRNENLENKQQPKKIPNDVSCLEESIQPDTEPPLKKKRGRPRKVPLTPLTEDNNNNV